MSATRPASRRARVPVFSRRICSRIRSSAAVLRQPLPQGLQRLARLDATASAARAPAPRPSRRRFSASAILSRSIEAFTSFSAWSRCAARRRAEVQLAHIFRRHALLRQRAQPALQPRIDLLLHKRSREQGTGTRRSTRPASCRAPGSRAHLFLRSAACSRSFVSNSSQLS